MHSTGSMSGVPTSVVIPVGGHEIDLGVGIDPTFISVQIAPCDGEYYVSAGDASADGYGEFFGAGEYMAFDRKHFVPWPLIRIAVREFVEYRRLSDSIRWVDWSGIPVRERSFDP